MCTRVWQADLEDQGNELRGAEEHAKKAMADAARIAEELRQEQEHGGHIEKMRRTLECQVSYEDSEVQIGTERGGHGQIGARSSAR